MCPSACSCKCTRKASLHTHVHRERDLFLLVVEHFHVAVLLNPKLANDDVVDTTSGVCPSVGFIISAETKKKPVKTKAT